MPKDKSQLPKWWRTANVCPISLYEVVGTNYSRVKKTLNIVASDELYAAKTARDHFSLETIETITLKLDVIWVPRSQ